MFGPLHLIKPTIYQPRILTAVAVVAACALAFWAILAGVGKSRPGDRADAEVLLQIGQSLKIYSAANNDRWLLPSAAPNLARLDAVPLASAIPNEAMRSLVSARLSSRRNPPLCYLGYALANESPALEVLDFLEKKNDASARGHLPPIELKLAPFIEADRRCKYVTPLSNGVERFFIRDILQPKAGTTFMIMERLPVVWEVPLEGDAGGWVLYLNGSVE